MTLVASSRLWLATAVLVLASTAAAPATAAGAAQSPVLAPGNFIHVVSHLDRTIAFYRDVLGLQQVRFGGGAAPRFAANPAVARLYHIPESTPIGVVMFRLPHTRVGLEFAEFRHVARKTEPTRDGGPQDPGAAMLILDVRHLDRILAKARAAHVPVVTRSGAAHSIIIEDPDGYDIELNASASDPAPGAASGNVLRSGLMLSVADIDRTVHFYHGLLGLPMQVDATFAPDPHGEVRHGIATIPGSQFRYDFVEWKGVERHPRHTRVFDPGVVVLRFVVSDVDGLVTRLKGDGVPVASTGGVPVALASGFDACILQGPGGIFIEPVPHFAPRRRGAASHAR